MSKNTRRVGSRANITAPTPGRRKTYVRSGVGYIGMYTVPHNPPAVIGAGGRNSRGGRSWAWRDPCQAGPARLTRRQAGRQTDRHTDGRTDGRMGRQAGRQADRQTNRRTWGQRIRETPDGQTDRETNRQPDLLQPASQPDGQAEGQAARQASWLGTAFFLLGPLLASQDASLASQAAQRPARQG